MKQTPSGVRPSIYIPLLPPNTNKTPQLLERAPHLTQPAVTLVMGWSGLRKIRSEWERLQELDSNHSPYCTWAWLEGWIQVFGATVTMMTLVVQDDSGPIGIVPFHHPRARRFGQMQRLRMVGYAGYVEPYCMVEEPICMIVPGQEDRVWAAVDRKLSEVLSSRDIDCAVYRRHISSAPKKGLSIRANGLVELRHAKPGPMVAETDGGWAAYKRQLSRSMRDNIAYYPKLLVRHGHTMEIRFERDPVAVAEACRTLVYLHRLRTWEDPKMEHKDYFDYPVHEHILESAIVEMAKAGRAFVAVMSIDGKPAAAQAFLSSDATLLLLYSGFDLAWSKYSPLFILQTEVLKEAANSGTYRFDFLMGKAQWQKRWAAANEGQIEKVVHLKLSPVTVARVIGYWVVRHSRVICLRSTMLRKLKRRGVLRNLRDSTPA